MIASVHSDGVHDFGEFIILENGVPSAQRADMDAGSM